MDGGALDAGPDAASPSDGGGIPDAGLCPTDSLARVDGGCRGSYCSMTFDGLGDASGPGACSGDSALRLACDGELARKTAQCAQEHALSLALGSVVRSCLKRDAQLRDVEGECVDCYVSELLCTLTSCLATCVADVESACTSCRREHCGAEFRRCSGLPAL